MSSTEFTDFILSKLTKASPKGAAVESLIIRYQFIAIIFINFFFLSVLFLWKIADILIVRLPGDEVIVTLPPIQILSLVMLKKGKKDISAGLLIIAIHLGNFLASKVCNVVLGAAYLIVLLPCLTYFVSSSKKVYIFNFGLCVLQNIGHMKRINSIFKVTFSDEQLSQIFTLTIVSFMYIVLSWMLFGYQKIIETNLWQVAQLNYTKAEEINKELVEAVETKDKVVSSFSHEMRNPLNALNGCIDYLLRVVTEAPYLKVLQNAKLSAEVLLNLVNNVLDAAKLRADKLDIVYSEDNPHELIKKAVSINSQTIAEKKIQSTILIQRGIPTKLCMDSSRILQILLNLLSNSIKFTREGGKINVFVNWCPESTRKEQLIQPYSNVSEQRSSPVIRSSQIGIQDINSIQVEPSGKNIDFDEYNIQENARRLKNILYMQENTIKCNNFDFNSCNSQSTSPFNRINSEFQISNFHNKTGALDRNLKGYLKFQISDTGCGIANDNIPKLFQMFSQIEINGTSIRNEGTGLGLWICKQLCQKMGGDIKLYSKIEGGTTVVFYIHINNQVSPQSLQSMRPVNDKLRALVVDDYAYNRDVHKLILEREGVEVIIACDGEEALEKYKNHREGYFSFIMMDIQMPKMDGLTAAYEMYQFDTINHRKNTDIYFVSGNYYSKNDVLGSKNLEQKNIQFLRKPIDLRVVKTIVCKYQDNSLH